MIEVDVRRGEGEVPPEDGEEPYFEFKRRFEELMDEAKACGVASLVVVFYDDRLADVEYSGAFHRNAGPVLAMGMAQLAVEHATMIGRVEES